MAGFKDILLICFMVYVVLHTSGANKPADFDVHGIDDTNPHDPTPLYDTKYIKKLIRNVRDADKLKSGIDNPAPTPSYANYIKTLSRKVRGADGGKLISEIGVFKSPVPTALSRNVRAVDSGKLDSGIGGLESASPTKFYEDGFNKLSRKVRDADKLKSGIDNPAPTPSYTNYIKKLSRKVRGADGGKLDPEHGAFKSPVPTELSRNVRAADSGKLDSGIGGLESASPTKLYEDGFNELSRKVRDADKFKSGIDNPAPTLTYANYIKKLSRKVRGADGGKLDSEIGVFKSPVPTELSRNVRAADSGKLDSI